MNEENKPASRRPVGGVVIRDGTGEQPTEIAALSGQAERIERLQDIHRRLIQVESTLSRFLGEDSEALKELRLEIKSTRRSLLDAMNAEGRPG